MSESSILRPIAPTDLEAVADLEAKCFSMPWSAKALELLLEPPGYGVVLLWEGRVVGYGGMLLGPFEGQVTNIAVDPAYRRRGYGRELTRALLSAARERSLEEVSLEVRASNAPAIAMYEALGFFVAGRRKNFYSAPVEDGLVMLCPLQKDA